MSSHSGAAGGAVNATKMKVRPVVLEFERDLCVFEEEKLRFFLNNGILNHFYFDTS